VLKNNNIHEGFIFNNFFFNISPQWKFILHVDDKNDKYYIINVFLHFILRALTTHSFSLSLSLYIYIYYTHIRTLSPGSYRCELFPPFHSDTLPDNVYTRQGQKKPLCSTMHFAGKLRISQVARKYVYVVLRVCATAIFVCRLKKNTPRYVYIKKKTRKKIPLVKIFTTIRHSYAYPVRRLNAYKLCTNVCSWRTAWLHINTQHCVRFFDISSDGDTANKRESIFFFLFFFTIFDPFRGIGTCHKIV